MSHIQKAIQTKNVKVKSISPHQYNELIRLGFKVNYIFTK